MPDIQQATANMAAAFDRDPLVRGFALGAEAAFQELTRRGLIPKEEAKQ